MNTHTPKTSLYINLFIFDLDRWYLVNFDGLTKRLTKTFVKQKKSMSHKRPPVHSVYFICIRHMLIPYNPLCDKFLPRPCILFLCGCFCPRLVRNVLPVPDNALCAGLSYIYYPTPRSKNHSSDWGYKKLTRKSNDWLFLSDFVLRKRVPLFTCYNV